MKKFILFGGVFSLLIGFIFDLYAISYTGYIFFSIGLASLIGHIVFDFKRYSPFLTFNKIMRDPLEKALPFLMESAGRILILILCALSIVTLAMNLFFRNTEAFAELKRKVMNGRTDAKIGFVITGSLVNSSKPGVETTASFEYSIFESTQGFKVNARLKKRDEHWEIEEYSVDD